MTDAGPTNTFFTLEACRLIAAYNPLGHSDYVLPVLKDDGSVRISMDQDRENYVEVVLQLEWLPDHIYRALDPRAQNTLAAAPIRMRVAEKDGNGTILRYWPGMVVATEQDEAQLWIRSITRDWTSRTVTLVLSSGELFLSDKIRLAGTALATGATTVRTLVNYSLGDVFGSASLASWASIVNTTALPVGDRRNMQPGQSHLDLIKSELDAIDARVIDYFGLAWTAELRSTTVGQARLSTSPDYGTDADPIVWEVSDTLSRDGRWYDGVLMEFDTRAYGGSVVWQASGAGVNTRGQVIRRDRPSPSANAANALAGRTAIRGRDTDVTARARLDIRPMMTAAIFTFDATLQGALRAVEYSFPEGEMRLRIEQ